MFCKYKLNGFKVTVNTFLVFIFPQKYLPPHLILALIRIISWTLNQCILMISEGSRDTEDWSNDAEKSALPLQE